MPGIHDLSLLQQRKVVDTGLRRLDAGGTEESITRTHGIMPAAANTAGHLQGARNHRAGAGRVPPDRGPTPASPGRTDPAAAALPPAPWQRAAATPDRPAVRARAVRYRRGRWR